LNEESFFIVLTLTCGTFWRLKRLLGGNGEKLLLSCIVLRYKNNHSEEKSIAEVIVKNKITGIRSLAMITNEICLWRA
jgi:hypothetical protein